MTILLKTLPTVIGTVAGGLFMIFPDKRHGIGYPITSNFHHTPIQMKMPSQFMISTIRKFSLSLQLVQKSNTNIVTT